MKKESEKKSIVKSIKLSPSQEEQIKLKAQEKNMTFSAYLVDCAVHGSDCITPQMAVKLQEIVNLVSEIYEDTDADDYIKKETLRQKADDLSDLFKSVAPKEKYKNYKKNVEALMEGAEGVWESLK